MTSAQFITSTFRPSFRAGGLHVYERKFIRELAEGVTPWLDLAIWLSASCLLLDIIE